MNLEQHNPIIDKEKEAKLEVENLEDFDLDYFKKLEGEDGWIAIDQENCSNQRYFTVMGNNEKKLGIVGVYDTEEDKNISHTVVDPSFRGRGLAANFKELLMNKLDLPFITLTVDLDNTSSIRAIEKLPGVEKVSNKEYEEKYHKIKYVFKRPSGENKY